MPEPFAPLELAGHRGKPLPCLFHAKGGEAGTAVVLPGTSRFGGRVGGTPARPELSYVRSLLVSLGLGVLEVWWQTDQLPEAAFDAWLCENGQAALSAANARAPLKVVVARSLGTIALSRTLDAAGDAHTVWLAPLLREAGVKEAIEAAGPRAFVVAGDSDPRFDPAAAAPLREAGVQLMLLEGADHALEVPDPAASARLLADVIDELRAFLSPAAATVSDRT